METDHQSALVSGKPLRSNNGEIPLVGGDIDFEGLYRKYARRVYTLCWRMVWDKGDAEDLTQEVFVQLLRKIGTFRGESAFTTWLHRLTVNVVLMGARKKSRIESPLGEGAELGELPEHASEELADPFTVPAGGIDSVDLEQAMAQLPPGFRHVFVLHDVEGYAHAEIAGMLGITEGTSKSQLHKARLRLRQLLRVPESRHLRGEKSFKPPGGQKRVSPWQVPPQEASRAWAQRRRPARARIQPALPVDEPAPIEQEVA